WRSGSSLTEDYVKKALKMEGLSGTALTSHKNYNLLVKYVDTAEMYRLNKWARGGFPTYDIWVELGLGRVTSLAQIEQVKNTNAYRIYKRYVNAFDDSVISTMGSGYHLPKLVSDKATPAEMTARAQIWAEAGRSDDYVMMMLGLTGLKGAKLARNRNYPYYTEFLAKRQVNPRY
ncbi:hypothetical protein PHYSODRAFT_513852, partial [Phytophthora sojae]